MELQIDGDLKAVAEFMQNTIPASKLLSVAEDLPKMGRLLWARYPQEPSLGLMLSEPMITSDSPRAASESFPESLCVGGGSAAEASCL